MCTCDDLCPPNPRGWNVFGQLGVGSGAAHGDSPGSMGDALPAVNFGPGRTAVEVSTTNSHTCALLDDGSIRCWGLNDYGQLGMGDTANRFGPLGANGTLMPAVSLGTGAVVRSVLLCFRVYRFRVGVWDLGVKAKVLGLWF